MLIPTIVGGLAHGGTYAVLAVGLVLIYRATGILHFAHGSIASAGVYGAVLALDAGSGVGPAAVLCVGVAAGLGAAAYRGVLRPLHAGGHHAVILASLALMLLFEGALAVVVGTDVRPPPALVPPTAIVRLGSGVSLAGADALVIAAGIAAIGSLGFALRWTRWGIRLRAAAASPDAARMWNIDVEALRAQAWLVASALGGLAGLLIASRTFVEPSAMMGPITKAFAAAAIGGFRSFRGAAVGAWGLGVVEALAGAYVSTTLQAALAYLVLVVVLAARPSPQGPSEARL